MNSQHADLNNWQDRTEILLGKDNVEALSEKTVLICGLGGVGGYVVEALARLGVGKFILADKDAVDVTNLNRQILATVDTIGKLKSEVAKERILSINPKAQVEALVLDLNDGTILELFSKYSFDCVIDAIDCINAKLVLAVECQKRGIPIIASMSTGNKFHPELFRISDIYKTSVCPIAKIMRKKAKELGIKKLTVVYSEELPTKHSDSHIGTLSFVPAAAGLLLVSASLEYLTGKKEK